MWISRRTLIIAGALARRGWAQTVAPQRYPEAPFVPTPGEVIDAMLDLARVRASDVVYDLGCGDGRILVAAARRFGATGLGVDIDRDLLADAENRARREGVEGKVKFIEADLFETDLRPATVVALYLIPKVLEKLKPKLLDELRPGARVVSFSFPIGDWTPTKVQRVDNRPVYLWVVPARGKARGN